MTCQERRGRPDREPGVRTSKSKNRFQSEKESISELRNVSISETLGGTYIFFFSEILLHSNIMNCQNGDEWWHLSDDYI